MSNTRLIIDSGVFFARKEQVIVFGVEAWILRSLFNICSSLSIYDFAICWDSSHSLRKELYPEYKAKRKNDEEFTPEELHRFYTARRHTRTELLPSMGIVNNFIQTGYEADDLVAQAIDPDYHNVIVSNDHDLYQLLSPSTSIWQPLKKRMFTYDDFKSEFEIDPDQWVHVKSLKGDTSDNIEGLANIGEKRALKIVKRQEFDLAKQAFADIIDRNIQLMRLPFDGCKNIKWKTNKPNQLAFEKEVDKRNLDWFYSSLGLGCAHKFFSGYSENKVKTAIRRGLSHGSKRSQ